MKPITVLLAEDHVIMREGLRLLLKASGDFSVIGEAATGREAVGMAIALQPDVIVMDVAMPLLNGFEATRQIVRAVPKARILALSAHGDDDYVMRMMEAGATGYLLKHSTADMLAGMLREIAAGRPCFSPAILQRRKSRERRASTQDGGGRPKSLTTREAEVLQLVAEGSANKHIATELGISIKTVEKHRQHLMDKLDIHDTAGLTRHAISTGVIESSSQGTTR